MLIVAVMIGCGGGGSGDVAGNGGTGGSGGNQNPPPPPPPDDDPVEVEGPTALVRWSPAAGPVAGYNVLVSRNGGGYEEEISTPVASADVEGDPGDLVRVRVAAFDAFGNSGPFSPASEPFKFVAAPPTTPPDDGGTPPDDDGEVAGGGSGGSDTGGGTGRGTPPGESPEEPSGPVRPYDLDGDGWVDLVWQSADGSLVRVTSVDLTHARVYSLPAGGWRVAATGDFDGDGASDLLFSNASELALARGSALRAGPGELALETWGALAGGSLVGAIGDFDADAASDAVVLSTAGASYVALANGTSVPLPAFEPDTALVGAGDADGDHHADLFVQGPLGVSLWRVVAGSVVSTQSLQTPIAAVEGVGDFDGNGSHDLAFRIAPDTLTIRHTQEPFDAWTETVPAGAALAGCRDYDGDGALDRLWQAPEALHRVTASGAQTIELAPDSSWRLVRDCR